MKKINNEQLKALHTVLQRLGMMDKNTYIRENYLHIPIKRMAINLGCSQTLVRGRMKKMGIFVPKALAEHRRKNNQFSKGHNPHNAGNVGVRVSPKTEFKKGRLPHNTAYDGCIRVRNDRDSKSGKIRQYKYIRIAKAQWKLLQRHVWEEANGSIPKGHNVQFLDGDQLNCELENLYLISRAEQAKKNADSEKAGLTHTMNIEEGYQPPSVALTDNYVASRMVGPNKNAQEMLKNHPELLEAKRQIILINRTTKNHGK